jgi:hypothetical protein
MASVVNDPGGRRRIQFVAPEGSRKSIRLGKCDRKSAEGISRHVEALSVAKIGGQPTPRDTAAWLATIAPALRDKLAAVGLIEARERTTLGAFLDTFIANRKATAAPNTITNLEQAKRRLVEYFRADRDIAAITLANAEAWAAALAEKYAPATAGRTIKRARQFFKAAMRNKLVTENVFMDVRASGQANKDRQFHVHRDHLSRNRRGPGCRVAANHRPIAVRRPPLPVGTPGPTLARRGLGAQPLPRSFNQDRRTLDSDIPRAAALPGRVL